MASQDAKTQARRKSAAKLTRGFRGILVYLFVVSGIIPGSQMTAQRVQVTAVID